MTGHCIIVFLMHSSCASVLSPDGTQICMGISSVILFHLCNEKEMATITTDVVNAFDFRGGVQINITKISEQQQEIKPNFWGWWVWSEGQQERVTSYFESLYGSHPGYNNALLVDFTHAKRPPGAISKPIHMILAVGS